MTPESGSDERDAFLLEASDEGSVLCEEPVACGERHRTSSSLAACTTASISKWESSGLVR